jgi:hypothetical protein
MNGDYQLVVVDGDRILVWFRAERLRVGDLVLLPGGGRGTVTSLEIGPEFAVAGLVAERM